MVSWKFNSALGQEMACCLMVVSCFRIHCLLIVKKNDQKCINTMLHEHHKCPATQLFIQQLVQDNNKENVESISMSGHHHISVHIFNCNQAALRTLLSVRPSVCPSALLGMALWATKAIVVLPWHTCGLIYMHVGCTSLACHIMETKKMNVKLIYINFVLYPTH